MARGQLISRQPVLAHALVPEHSGAFCLTSLMRKPRRVPQLALVACARLSNCMHCGLELSDTFSQIVGSRFCAPVTFDNLPRRNRREFLRVPGKACPVAFPQDPALARSQHFLLPLRHTVAGLPEQKLHAPRPDIAIGVEDEDLPLRLNQVVGSPAEMVRSSGVRENPPLAGRTPCRGRPKPGAIQPPTDRYAGLAASRHITFIRLIEHDVGLPTGTPVAVNDESRRDACTPR